jgi:hypothetical protein
MMETTSQDIGDFQSYVIGSSIESYRLGSARVNRDLITQNRLLMTYRSNSALLTAKALNNLSLLDIESRHTPDTFENPIQQMDNDGSVPPIPDQGIGFNKSMVARTMEGINARDAELNKINNDILLCLSKIRKLNRYRLLIEEKLAQAARDPRQSPRLLTGLLPNQPLLSPKSSDMNKDRIAKARIENLYLLYQLHTNYLNCTTIVKLLRAESESATTVEVVQDSQIRGFPDEEMLVRNLIVLREVFAAHAKGFPDNELFQTTSASGPSFPPINLADPGDPVNGQILRSKLASERAASTSDAVPEQIQKYVTELSTLAMDPSTSKGISRKPTGGLSAKDSMNKATQTYPVAVMRFGVFYKGSFEIPSFYEAVRKWFKRDKSKNFQNLPMCSALPSQTTTDEKLSFQTSSRAFDEAEGRGQYKRKREGVGNKAEEDLSAIKSQIPADAPQWVIEFIKSYGIGVDVESRQVGSNAIYTGSAYTSGSAALALGKSGKQKSEQDAATNVKVTYGKDLIPETAVFEYYSFSTKEGTWFGYARYSGIVFVSQVIPGNETTAQKTGIDPNSFSGNWPTNIYGKPLDKGGPRGVDATLERVNAYTSRIETLSKQYDVDPTIIKALISQESQGHPEAASSAGAVGLTQVMDTKEHPTWDYIATEILKEKRGNINDPDTQLRYGIAYYAHLKKKYNSDDTLTLARYNAGEGNVRKYGQTVPPFKETQNYIKNILGYQEMYKTQAQ